MKNDLITKRLRKTIEQVTDTGTVFIPGGIKTITPLRVEQLNKVFSEFGLKLTKI